jgi:serine/threonine-protein kinase
VLSRFVLGGLLGTGASASVFQATDTLTGNVVAVKVLHPKLSAREELSERFLEEASNVSEIAHPNMTKVIGWGSDSSSGKKDSWIAYELAPGISLAEYVELNGPLHPADAITMARGILSALGAFHRAGFVHRDISPQNVILDIHSPAALMTSDIRLIDYGLVGKIGTNTRNGSGVVGNAHFISPEQARGDGVYVSGDIYQTGAVLFFALTGRTPFSAETTEDLIKAHYALTPPVASAVVNGIPRELDRAVVKAMLKSPTMRYRNIDDFDRSLSAIFGRQEATVEVGQLTLDGLDQTKVLQTSPTSFVDFDRTMLLSASFTESQKAEELSLKSLFPRRKKFRLASWVWPIGFGTVLLASLVISLVSSQPVLPSVALGAQHSQAPSETSKDLAPTSPTAVDVPDVTKLTRDEAIQALTNAGLSLGVETFSESPSTENIVLSSEPQAGSTVSPNSKVAITIASGRNRVPQVVGLSNFEAIRLLEDAGFSVTITDDNGIPQHSSIVDASLPVRLLKPSAGSLLRVGSTVIILVKIPDAGPSTTPIPVMTESPSAPPQPTF